MSGKKGFEVDETTDSGFLSGPIDRLPGDEEEEIEKEKEACDSGNVKSASVSISVTEPLDSGLDLCLSECLDSLRVSETESAPPPPLDTDIPPLSFLFQQDDDGDTQLHIAAVHGCQKSVSTLIRVCPDKYWLNLPNDYGHTPLHLAVMSGHAIVARMLVQAGALLGLRDLRGDTAIHTATRGKHMDCLQALLAPIDMRPNKGLVKILNQKNYEGQTCVHVAANLGHIPTLQTLLYYGADINAREGLAGWTALHIAARRGDVRLAQHILERCDGVQSRARDYAGRTPRKMALKNPAFSGKDGQKLWKALPEDSDTESEDDDEYDSDDPESLFEKIRGSIATAVATN
ncbi:ankyrin repeats (3 copies) domain-containing protein [Phthorimaea operculella]|nr:ankyrin repeats (3 copies) domain-containing protein [Phthorimaea operculella]